MPIQLPGPSSSFQGDGALGLGTDKAPGTTASQMKGHKRTNSGGAGGYWRTGRSISLSGAKGLSGGLSFGKPTGSTKRLAKTAHMHEVKTPRSATIGDSGTGPGRASGTATDQGVSQSLSVLSPMMEDPYSAGMVGFGDALPRQSDTKPVRIGGFNAEIGAAQSEGALSNPFGPVISAAPSSFGLDSSSGQNSGIGIPFPSPAMDGEGDDDVWVDESGEGEAYDDERDTQEVAMSSSPTRVKRGSGFAFGSPRRPFVFASSPPGKPRLKKRSDIIAPTVHGERL